MTSPSSTYTAYIRESNTLKLIEHFCHLGSINWKAITASHAPNDHINCQHYAWHPTGWSSAWGALRKHQTRERSHAKLTCRWSALKSKNKLPSPCVTVANHQWMCLVVKDSCLLGWNGTHYSRCVVQSHGNKTENMERALQSIYRHSLTCCFSCSSFLFTAHLSMRIIRLQDFFLRFLLFVSHLVWESEPWFQSS